jgi:signal transduction histidine kinase
MESGAGLGLAIVDAIAAAHGGGIVIRNRSEGGADVQLRLPLGRSSGQSFEQSFERS